MVAAGSAPLTTGTGADQILRRPEITYEKMEKYLGCPHFAQDAAEEMEIMIKYEGYIEKQKRDAKNMIKLESMKIPEDLDFMNMDGLAIEARQKFTKIRPLTIGQASRISGVNPSDISILIMNLKKGNK